MRKIIAAVLLSALLGGCTVASIPPGYKGSVAHITDSMTPRGGYGIDIFYLTKIGDRQIDDSLMLTIQANRYRGINMVPKIIGRDVPTEPASFAIVGRTHYAIPLLDILNKVYEVKGVTNFTPQPNHAYIVKGVLGDGYSAVWIEDQTGEVAGQKIEDKASTALGLFAK